MFFFSISFAFLHCFWRKWFIFCSGLDRATRFYTLQVANFIGLLKVNFASEPLVDIVGPLCVRVDKIRSARKQRFQKYQTNAARKHLLKLVLLSSINLLGMVWRNSIFYTKQTPLANTFSNWCCFLRKTSRDGSLRGLSKKTTPIWEGVCERRLFDIFWNASQLYI